MLHVLLVLTSMCQHGFLSCCSSINNSGLKKRVELKGEEVSTRVVYGVLDSSVGVGKRCHPGTITLQRNVLNSLEKWDFIGLGYLRCHMHFCLEHSMHLINIY